MAQIKRDPDASKKIGPVHFQALRQHQDQGMQGQRSSLQLGTKQTGSRRYLVRLEGSDIVIEVDAGSMSYWMIRVDGKEVHQQHDNPESQYTEIQRRTMEVLDW